MTAAPRSSAGARLPHGLDWDGARAAAASWSPFDARPIALLDAVGAVLAADLLAPRAVPHYDSSAMDGWAVAGPPPWRISDAGPIAPGQARPIVTGGALPSGAVAVVPTERGRLLDGLLDGPEPEPQAHVRRTGEEAPAGARLVAAGTRLSPAHVAVLSIAGLDTVNARPRPRVGIVLTGDEVVTTGVPIAGRVRDAFDPLLPLAVGRLGSVALAPVRVGDDPRAIRAAIDGFGESDVVITVGGTGRSRSDRLREAVSDAETVLDGVAMRPGHPVVVARLPDGRPLLGLPGNPLAAVAALLSFLPAIVDGLTAGHAAGIGSVTTAVALDGWAGGVSLVPCTAGPHGLSPAPATRPNMLRGLAASDVLAVVPPEGSAPGSTVRVLPLPW